MSAKELKGLSKGICLQLKAHPGKIRQMSEREEPAATGTVEELSVRMERLREELRRRDRELEELRTVAARASTSTREGDGLSRAVDQRDQEKPGGCSCWRG